MKKSLLAVLMISGAVAFAQTPRLSLYEEFTGETCPPCAATNPGLNAILLTPTNQTKIVAIKWQVPIPSAPTPTWSLYKTNQTEIDWRYRSTGAGGYGYPSQNTATNAITSGINSAPSGRIDGQHQWAFGATSDHPFYMSNAIINTAQSYTSAFSVIMTRAWDLTYSSVNLTVNITASAPFTAVGNLVFRCVMVEREIQFDVQPGTNGEKFFEDVAVKSFPTLQAGTSMASSWTTSQNMTFTLNCPLPSYIRDKSQVAFVGFIQDDGDRKVAQTVRANVDPVPNDAKALTTHLPPYTCATAMTPTIEVENVGNNTITSMTITPYVNSVAQPNFIWTGTLLQTASVTIPMSPVTIPAGVVNFSYNITGVNNTDNNMLNNFKKKSSISIQSYQSNPVAEGFVSAVFPPANFAIYAPGGGATWTRVTNTGGFQLSSNAAKLDLYTTVAAGSVHEMLLPPMNFTASPYTPKLTFDVAYSKYATADDDLLEVMASDDCGASWSTLYAKSGTNLSTTGTTILAAFTPTVAGQWRKETVNLTGFTSGNVIIKFVGTSDFGNNMYLDNINLVQECATQTVSIAAPANKVCAGMPATLTATGANSFTWSTGGNGTSIVITPTAATTYTAFSTDAEGCGNSAMITVTVGTPQNITITSNKPTLCLGQSATLTAAGANGVQWSDQLQTNALKLVVLPTTTGNIVYSATSTDANGCNNVGSFTMTVSKCVGLDENAVTAHELFPNPNSGEFVLTGEFKTGSHLNIYNNLGQHVYVQPLTSGSNAVKCELASGVYHYTVVEGSGVTATGNLIIR